MSHEKTHIEVLTEIRDIVNEHLSVSKSQPTGIGSIGSGIEPVSPGGKPASVDADKLKTVNDLYSKTLAKFFAFRPRVNGHFTLLDEIQRHLNAVRISDAMNSFDLLRERLEETPPNESIPDTLAMRDSMLALRNSIGDIPVNLITGHTDVGLDMKGVTDGNDPVGD